MSGPQVQQGAVTQANACQHQAAALAVPTELKEPVPRYTNIFSSSTGNPLVRSSYRFGYDQPLLGLTHQHAGSGRGSCGELGTQEPVSVL